MKTTEAETPEKVAVVIPVYNGEHYIGRALESVFSQTHQNFEIIIVNDKSTDGTAENILQYLSDSRITYLENKVNIGLSKSRNRALLQCKSEYVSFLDHDDEWHPKKLQIQLDAFRKNPSLALVHADMALMDSNGTLFPKYRDLHESAFGNEMAKFSLAPSFEALLESNTIQVPTVMARRDIIVQLGGFPEALVAVEDYGLWLRVALKHPVGYIQTILAKYRIHDSQMSKNGYKMLTERLAMLEAFVIENPGTWQTRHRETLRRRLHDLNRDAADYFLVGLGDELKARDHYMRAFLNDKTDLKSLAKAAYCSAPEPARALARHVKKSLTGAKH